MSWPISGHAKKHHELDRYAGDISLEHAVTHAGLRIDHATRSDCLHDSVNQRQHGDADDDGV